MNTVEASEESARLTVPPRTGDDPFHQPAFYNPRMQFNRTISSIALGAGTAKTVLDGLCATGSRGIRYALENDVDKVTLVDANEHAGTLCRENIKLNKLSKRAEFVSSELNAFLCHTGEGRQEYEWIELDPFGSPVPFLDSSIRRLASQKGGVLSATATDLAKLCGAEPKKCLRHYASLPQRSRYSHETALRILYGAVARFAAVYDCAPQPLVSFYQGHAIKVIARIEPGAGKADKALGQLGLLCDVEGDKRVETGLGAAKKAAGPLWLGDLSDESFVEKMVGVNAARDYAGKEKIGGFLKTIAKEQCFPPWHWDVHELARRLGGLAPKNEAVLGALRQAGHRAEPCHYSPTGFKTDASLDELRECWPA